MHRVRLSQPLQRYRYHSLRCLFNCHESVCGSTAFAKGHQQTISASSSRRCRPLHTPPDDPNQPNSALQHFHDKLLHIKGRLKTTPGQKMGAERHQVVSPMLEFWGCLCVLIGASTDILQYVHLHPSFSTSCRPLMMSMLLNPKVDFDHPRHPGNSPKRTL